MYDTVQFTCWKVMVYGNNFSHGLLAELSHGYMYYVADM